MTLVSLPDSSSLSSYTAELELEYSSLFTPAINRLAKDLYGTIEIK
jgi:hypothetical protein